MRVDLPGRDRCAGEKTDEQGSNRREREARTEMSHEVPPSDSETRAIVDPPSHTRESSSCEGLDHCPPQGHRDEQCEQTEVSARVAGPVSGHEKAARERLDDSEAYGMD